MTDRADPAPAPSRRQPLRRAGAGFGALTARAKRVIFLFMPGGPSQVDTFDPKPELTRRPWDPHSDLKGGHAKNALATDRPISGLLEDLAARGLLDDTLVIWGGEFGRTPAAEGADGRDRHPYGFTMWLAGGGKTHGETDEFGWDAVQDRTHVHDLHATILHLLGLDHERLTYRHGGRDYRLTDVSGTIIRGILA